MVAAFVAEPVQRKPTDFREKAYFKVDPSAVRRFRITRGVGVLTLE
jgi:hypothetical protein